MPPPAAPPLTKDLRPGRTSTAPERDDFLCRIKYLNRLPDLPADPKFLVYNIDMSPYVRYTATTLEKEYRRDINCDTDMGMKLNLLTPQSRKMDSLDADSKIDVLLCADETLTESASKPMRMDHGRHVAWLRKSQYILNDFAQRAESAPEKHLRQAQPQLIEATLRTRAKRVEAIQETFDYANNKPKRHPNKPNLTVVDEIPLLPNFDLAKYPNVIVTFESDPTPPHIPHFSADEIMANAMLRGMTDENGNQLVAYFMPTEETLQNLLETRGRRDDQEEYIYKLHREFSLPMDDRPRGSRGDDQVYALNIRDNAVMYTDLETKVRLLRRVRGNKKNKSRLVVRFRSLNTIELDERRTRMEAFEMSPPQEDEELRREATPAPVTEKSGESSSEEEEANHPEEEGPTDEETEPADVNKSKEDGEENASSPSVSTKSSPAGSNVSSDDENPPTTKPPLDAKAELFGSDSDEESD